jgi:hypothetical protein
MSIWGCLFMGLLGEGEVRADSCATQRIRDSHVPDLLAKSLYSL